MSMPGEEGPKPQVAARLPKPPGIGARPAEERRNHATRTVYLLDRMIVKDVAVVIGVKPFQVVADLMQLKLFKSPEDEVDFEIASAVARKHGCRPERPPPGALVL